MENTGFLWSGRDSLPLLDIMGKSKEISKDLRKNIVDLHKSGSSLGAISKRLKVPRSSVQTIVRKYISEMPVAHMPVGTGPVNIRDASGPYACKYWTY